MSLIELMVSISIVSLLIGLVLVAVQSSREVSRRMTCSNRLRQLNIGLHSFEVATGKLPGFLAKVERGVAPQLSGLTELLPYVEKETLYQRWIEAEAIPFKLDPWSPVLPARSIALYQCPSDDQVGGGNYRMNGGSTTSLHSNHHVIWRNGNSPFAEHRSESQRIRAGRSSTASFSERLQARQDGSYDHRRNIYPAGVYDVVHDDDITDQIFIEIAHSVGSRRPPRFENHAGLSPYGTGHVFSTYNHVFTPNYAVASVVAHGSADRLSSVFDGLVTATSNHPGGVQIAILDGSVRFISDSIDQRVYQNLGSRLLSSEAN